MDTVVLSDDLRKKCLSDIYSEIVVCVNLTIQTIALHKKMCT